MPGTVADQFVETLAAAGVGRIYGVVGDSLNGLTDSIRRQGEIAWVHVRNEDAGAFAAGAHLAPAREHYAKARKALDELAIGVPGGRLIHPQRVAKALSARARTNLWR